MDNDNNNNNGVHIHVYIHHGRLPLWHQQPKFNKIIIQMS
jgi:hypothetical protein